MEGHEWLHVRGRWHAPIEAERDGVTQSARWRGERGGAARARAVCGGHAG